MSFMEKLMKMGYSESDAEKIYLFYMEFGSLGDLVEPEEIEKDNKDK